MERLVIAGAVLFAVGVMTAAGVGRAQDRATSDLSYESFIASDKRIKCLYGYAADKTGDHAAAIAIFEDCIRRWNDVYSMIWLAQIYDTGVGAPRDPARAAALLRQGAETDDPAGYSAIARYHYGVALYEGRGVPVDRPGGVHWLQRAADAGVADAVAYLSSVRGGP